MRLRKKQKSLSHSPDWTYITLLWVIIIFGLVMLASVGVSVGYEKYGDANYFLKQQVWWGVLPGLALFAVIALVDYHIWQKLAKYIFIVSIILLVMVFIPGFSFSYGGASRWLSIGAVFFQPGEIIKLTLLIFLADWLSQNTDKVADFKQHFLPFAAILATVIALILLQPDMGTAFMIVIIGLVSYFVASGNLVYLSGLSGVGAIFFFILIKTEGYRMKRLMTFLHPELDPLGIGYHINQALLAIGSGGIFGRGYGLSRQKFMYLPEVVTDSIFAIIAEELGFILVVVLVLLFFWLFWQGFKIGERAPDLFGKLLVVTISSWLMIQALVNIGAMVGLLPMTGIPLPFISYGRSSLLVSMMATGMVVNVSQWTKRRKLG